MDKNGTKIDQKSFKNQTKNHAHTNTHTQRKKRGKSEHAHAAFSGDASNGIATLGTYLDIEREARKDLKTRMSEMHLIDVAYLHALSLRLQGAVTHLQEL